jgi:hypothetical protein
MVPDWTLRWRWRRKIVGRVAEAGRTQSELQYGKALLPSPGHPDDVGKRVI